MSGWSGGDGRALPALLRISANSFRVALLGSTPKERENSFVARSIVLFRGLRGRWVGELWKGDA